MGSGSCGASATAVASREEVLRQDPNGVVALILDSPLTAEAVGPAARIANDAASTATLSSVCAAQPSCASVTPDLGASIDAAIAQANAHPYTAHPTASDGTKVSVVMTGQEVLEGKVFVTADASSVGLLPSAAKSIAAGETATLDLIAAQDADPPSGPIAFERRDRVRRRPSGMDRGRPDGDRRPR